MSSIKKQGKGVVSYGITSRALDIASKALSITGQVLLDFFIEKSIRKIRVCYTRSFALKYETWWSFSSLRFK